MGNLYDQDVELTVLGMAMIDRSVAEKISLLPNDAFVGSDTRAMFHGIKRVIENHGTPDLVTVKRACDEIEMDPGNSIVVASRNAITSANYGQYETILMDLRKRRLLYKACADLCTHISNIGEDANSLAEKVLSAIQDGSETPSSISAKDALMKLTAYLENKRDDRLSTGVIGIDKYLGGLHPERLYVLGARPGVGKTALALYIATNVAIKSGPVLIVSLEMSDQQILSRIMAYESGIDSEKLDNRTMEEKDWEAYSRSMPAVANLPIRFTESAKTPMQIRREAQAMIQNGGLKLIVVDYLQLMNGDKECGSRQEEISQISRELKLITMDLKIPILALTQFNRESEAKSGTKKRKPSMSEARESGAIEQDANVFMVLWPPDEPKEGTVERHWWDYCKANGTEWQALSIDKNRHGRTGIISLEFDKAHMGFTTLEQMEEEAG